MKRKILIALLTLMTATACSLCFAACGSSDDVNPGGGSTSGPETEAHTLTRVAAKAPDCREEGNIEYWHCAVCNKYYADSSEEREISLSDTVLAKSAHALRSVAEVSATCVSAGKKAYHECAVCGEKFSDAQAAEKITDEDSLLLPATGVHESVYHAEIPSDCVSPGTDEYWSCRTCDGLFSDGACTVAVGPEDIAKTEYGSHALAFVAEKAGTCSLAGVAAHYRCGRCDALFRDEEGLNRVDSEIDLATPFDTTRHALTVVPGIPATCSAAGTKEYWVCSDCSGSFEDAQGSTPLDWGSLELPKLPHSMTHHAAIAPNCAESGRREYWECADCYRSFADSEGLIETYDIDLPPDSSNHKNLSHHARVEATCIADGMQEYSYCDGCQYYFDEYMFMQSYDSLVIPHDMAYHSTVSVSPREASCLPGIRMACYRCRHCEGYFTEQYPYIGTELDRSEVEIPATGIHNASHVSGAAASCTAQGIIEHWSCPTCGKLFADLGCTEEVSREAVVRPQLPHDIAFRPETASTCSAKGFSEHYYCRSCDSRFSDAEGEHAVSAAEVEKPLLPHAYSDEWLYDVNEHWHPTACGCDVRGSIQTHEYEAISRDEPLCVFVGELTFECKVCDNTRTQIVTKPSSDHDFTAIGEVAATCSEEGLSAYYYCSMCRLNYLKQADGSYVRGEPAVIPVLGHDYLWTTVTPVSCTSDGLEEGACSRCGHTDTRTTPKLEHKQSLDYACNSVAHWNVCTYCDSPMTEWEVHKFAAGGTKCSKCNTSVVYNWNYEEYTDSSVFTYRLLDDDTYEITGIDAGFSGSLVISGIYNGKFVSSVSDEALKGNTSVTAIQFPASLTYIGDCSGCTSLTSVSFEDSIRLEKIVSFAGSAISGIRIPDSVQVIGERAFYNCNLESYTFPQNLLRIEAYAFAKNKQGRLRDLRVTIPDSCLYIGDHAFEYVEIEHLTLGKNLQHIGDFAFAYTFVRDARFPSSLTHMGEGAFAYDVMLRSIRFGSGLTSVPARAFAGSGAPDWSLVIEWGSRITSIGEEAFYQVYGLYSEDGMGAVKIPAGVTSIGARAFVSMFSVTSTMTVDVQFEERYGWVAGETAIADANETVRVESGEESNLLGIYANYREFVWTRTVA